MELVPRKAVIEVVLIILERCNSAQENSPTSFLDNIVQNLRVSFSHMRKSEFGDSKHLQNVASEHALNDVEINLGKILAHPLLSCIVDQDIDSSKSIQQKGRFVSSDNRDFQETTYFLTWSSTAL
jgi:hypothetical protein